MVDLQGLTVVRSGRRSHASCRTALRCATFGTVSNRANIVNQFRKRVPPFVFAWSSLIFGGMFLWNVATVHPESICFWVMIAATVASIANFVAWIEVYEDLRLVRIKLKSEEVDGNKENTGDGAADRANSESRS